MKRNEKQEALREWLQICLYISVSELGKIAEIKHSTIYHLLRKFYKKPREFNEVRQVAFSTYLEKSLSNRGDRQRLARSTKIPICQICHYIYKRHLPDEGKRELITKEIRGLSVSLHDLIEDYLSP